MSKSKFEIKCEMATQILAGFISAHGAAYKSTNLSDEGLAGYVNLSKIAADSLYERMVGKASSVKFDMPESQKSNDNGDNE